MDHKTINKLNSLLKDIDAEVAVALKPMRSFEIAEAAAELMDNPVVSLLRCLSCKEFTEASATLMACAMIREAIRKANVEEMERET